MNQSRAQDDDNIRAAAGARESYSITRPRDPNDPFFFEAAFGIFDPSRLDTTDKALCAIDWIGGFANTDRLQLEVFVTPILRCLGRTPYTEATYCAAIAPLPRSQKVRNFGLGEVERLGPGCIVPLIKGRQLYELRQYTAIVEQRELTPVEMELVFQDAASSAMPYGDIAQLRPKVAQAIALLGPCPESVSFYILDSGDTTIAVPTASILQACFAPPHLAKHLTSARSSPFATGDVIFDGFRFTRSPAESYPIRAEKHIDRAEFEVSQILPRAAAYHKKHGRLLPLLVCPPFTGRATISGAGAVLREGKKTIVAFCGAIWFSSRGATRLKAAIQSSQFATKAFAPNLFRTLSIPNLTREYARSKYFEFDEYCDIHWFSYASKAVQDALQHGAMHDGPDVTYDVDEVIRFRNWCITKAWQGL